MAAAAKPKGGKLCSICNERRAALKRPKTLEQICRECFYSVFEDEIHNVIVENQLFKPGERIAIGASGGKDSTVLAYVLSELNRRHNYGLDLFLLSVDEGITGYRDDSLETVKRNEIQYGLPLKVVSYKELYGWTMDEIVKLIGLKNNCTFCGVFRRQALDRGAALLKVDKLVTGHNADDIAETVLLNILRGDIARLDYFSTECIYSPNAYRGFAREFIKDLERMRPRAILDIIKSGEDFRISASTKMPEQGNCERCGYISSQKWCKACVLLEGLNRGLPKLANNVEHWTSDVRTANLHCLLEVSLLENHCRIFGFRVYFSASVPMAIESLFKDEATEEKGERARMASFIGAMAIADLVKTTLGPKGMDKILQSTGRGHSVTVTNDGATILKSLHIDNPAAKVLVDISKVQDDEVGDGTTSVVVLAGELLREAEKLVNSKIHPMTIIAGYRMAAEAARNALLARVMDNKQDAEKFKEDLVKIAMTTLSSKILSQDKEHFATLAVDAVMRLKGSTNLESIQIIKKPGGSLKDSFLDEGFILDKKIGVGQPKRIENAKILVANTAMDTDKVKIYGARVRVDSMAKVAEIEGAEKEKMREKVQKIINHGINCFVNRQLIYNFPEELFADAGVLAIEHADFDGIERLALVTGGEIASTFDNPESVKLGHCRLIEEIMIVKLGHCRLIEEIMIGEDKLIHFSGVEMGQACTIVLRGASPHMLDEAERSLHDALCVLSQTVNDSRVLLGGGWPEMVMAKAVDELARRTPGKRSHAIEAFSRALVAIPTTIADNAGLDSAEMIAQLRAEHQNEESSAGIDVISGSVGNMADLGISEAFKVKQAVLLSATEAAEMILRVDEIITCAPRQREDRM
ncbi:unnamed protein product [Fraxinus pennsylvanica]|uniref:CCT-beta n=1 Tax=Fraxinus pennsylvanica TaxID=56036 RepID=A0AAD2E6G4_9LAMI|nr:unnamed protein product [Fraxinus pennsylvanica]